MIVKKVAAFQACAICHRTLLLGERTLRFSPSDGEWVDVCALCTDEAYEQSAHTSTHSPSLGEKRRVRSPSSNVR